MRAATVVQVLQDLFYVYCMFYFTCDRSLSLNHNVCGLDFNVFATTTTPCYCIYRPVGFAAVRSVTKALRGQTATSSLCTGLTGGHPLILIMIDSLKTRKRRPPGETDDAITQPSTLISRRETLSLRVQSIERRRTVFTSVQ